MISSLVLLSGGMDSTAALAHTLRTAPSARVEAVTVTYGQRHARRELAAAEAVADHFDIPLRVLDLAPVLSGARSALTRENLEIPDGHYTDESMNATVVPGRNLLILAAAASLAQTRALDQVVIGVHAGDHPVYADCRPSFITGARHAIEESSDDTVTLSAPFVTKSKADIAQIGWECDAPFHLTWSCYKGGDVHCGRCGTCVERAEAFHLAGVSDRTVYADAEFWITAAEGTTS